MQLVVKPVGFGDCCILREGPASLIVDCGSRSNPRFSARHAASTGRYAYSAICREMEGEGVVDVMITHFHSDHLNGFLHIPPAKWRQIQRVYLPWSLRDQRQYLADAVASLLLAAPAGSWGFQLARDAVELLTLLAKVSGQILFKKQGDRIWFAGAALEVLWPHVQMVEQLSLFGAPGTQGAEEPAWAGATPEERAMEDAVRRALRQQPGEGPDPWQLGRRLAAALSTYIELLSERGAREAESCRPAMEQVQGLYGRLLQARAQVQQAARQAPHLAQVLEKFAQARYDALIRDMNDTSLVCALGDRLLLTGDVGAEVIDTLRQAGLLCQTYHVVKAPHHGTHAHFLPPSEYLVVSNGYHKNWAVKEGVVAGASGRVVCTRAHKKSAYCGYRSAHRRCAARCIQVCDEQVIGL